MVQTLKSRLVKSLLDLDERSESHRLATFLLQYRVTPHATAGQSPAELLMRQSLRT